MLPCRACCINCVDWDWERDHRTRWCGGFMSSNPIPSPCGIPLIFSSVQIRLYCSSFGCYCYHSLSLSDSSHLIWSYFHMQDLAGGWWFCDRKANELEMDTSCPEKKMGSDWISVAGSIKTFFFLSLTYINTNDITLLYGTILWNQPPGSPWMSSFSVFGVSPPCAEMFCWLINSGQPSD